MTPHTLDLSKDDLWATWVCVHCCWTVPPAVREQAACEALIRAHMRSHDQRQPRLRWTDLLNQLKAVCAEQEQTIVDLTERCQALAAQFREVNDLNIQQNRELNELRDRLRALEGPR